MSDTAAQSVTAPAALIYVNDKESEDVLRHALAGLGVTDGVFRNGGVEAALAEAPTLSAPKLLIVDAGADVDLSAVARLMGVSSPATSVVVLGELNDLSLYRHLRDLGVAEYIFKPLVSTLVSKACQRALAGAPARAGAPMGEAVMVLGVRGGVGATTIAVRTAWALARHPPRPVLMLDLQLRFGDAALQLDQAPNEALNEALQSIERVDELFIERGVIHVAEHLDLMASLAPLSAPPAFAEDAVLALMEQVRRRYRYVVVDLPPAQAALAPRLLQSPGVVVLVSDGRLVSARDVRRWRETLGADKAERTVLHVLNLAGGPGDLPLEDFTRAAGAAPDIVVPWSRQIAADCNLGLKARPDSLDLQRALAPLLSRIAGTPVEADRLPLLARLFG
ncbi:MAG TPA: AAA family ATPase [Caulobacteraceae bacterium]|nr:AAA family ATPase [Caulobacteraceae bacterium]